MDQLVLRNLPTWHVAQHVKSRLQKYPRCASPDRTTTKHAHRLNPHNHTRHVSSYEAGASTAPLITSMSISRRKSGVIAKGGGGGPPGSMRPPPAPFSLRAPAQPPQSQAPSPSIAVIVQNYSKAGSGGTGGLPNRDAFQQLLAEILGPEDGGHEEDITTNYKVLQVVTSAGLTILLAQDEDPFANTQEVLQQASNSLLVIRLTIQRTPGVLFCPPPQGENNQPDQLFLYLWLFPRLFPLLGQHKARPLVAELLETLEVILFAVGSMSQHWKHLRTVVGYFRGCLNCNTFFPVCASFLVPRVPCFCFFCCFMENVR